ncbi:tripeptide aminopeptidase [Arcanobacterium wilhelmae]|uniref:Peptidase T n=1 Tax=Arcanobacterium wilhelmae TaxID=1803177 RepID=A0ABT9NCY8_9ACTO|nr:peptidase T [Arcanobacterium wilhelmae]MDP9801580.1 tripeptide aminopeptidase [Arcanobacterium wilhelmae]
MREELIERFMRYSAIESQSNAKATEVPSSSGQWEMIRLLEAELAELGAKRIHVDEHACLTAVFPATGTGPSVGFCAHVDTADVGLSPRVNAQVHDYAGGDIDLGRGPLSVADFPELERYVGDTVITTDGTSVLGADDKAAIAELMTAFGRLGDFPHGEVQIAFVPDEEIGLRGAKVLDMSRFNPDFAYTLDCGPIGEVVWETFNAGYARIEIDGVAAHPMSAKGVLVNPLLIAIDIANSFNRAETPENTEGREGYIWVQEMDAVQSHASLTLNIRDHSRQGYEEKKSRIAAVVDEIARREPRARVELVLEDTYANIADSMTEENRAGLTRLLEAFEYVGVEPKPTPMRGGTDGSYFSTQGLFTPNFFTGAHNFHSFHEFLPDGSMELATRIILRLVTAA